MERIPLFPLDMVLFPGMALPLHIFEPRYREMIRFCLGHRRIFGVVYARQEEEASVGCTAELLVVTRTYADGRMDIATQGRTRFRTKKLFQEAPYLEALVEYLEDTQEPTLPLDDPELRKHFVRCFRLFYGQGADVPELRPTHLLTYQIAAALPMDLDVKQTLLETRSEFDRRRLLHKLLPRWADAVERGQRERQKAAGNGRGGVDRN